MVFIKMEIVPRLKLCLKLNGRSRQHQSHCAMCSIINFLIFFFKELKILKKLKLKLKFCHPQTPCGW